MAFSLVISSSSRMLLALCLLCAVVLASSCAKKEEKSVGSEPAEATKPEVPAFTVKADGTLQNSVRNAIGASEYWSLYFNELQKAKGSDKAHVECSARFERKKTGDGGEPGEYEKLMLRLKHNGKEPDEYYSDGVVRLVLSVKDLTTGKVLYEHLMDKKLPESVEFRKGVETAQEAAFKKAESEITKDLPGIMNAAGVFTLGVFANDYPALLNPLLKQVNSGGSGKIHDSALDGLGRMGDKALPHIDALIKSKPADAAKAILGLRDITPALAPKLQGYLDTNSTEVRKAIVRIMGAHFPDHDLTRQVIAKALTFKDVRATVLDELKYHREKMTPKDLTLMVSGGSEDDKIGVMRSYIWEKRRGKSGGHFYSGPNMDRLATALKDPDAKATVLKLFDRIFEYEHNHVPAWGTAALGLYTSKDADVKAGAKYIISKIQKKPKHVQWDTYYKALLYGNSTQRYAAVHGMLKCYDKSLRHVETSFPKIVKLFDEEKDRKTKEKIAEFIARHIPMKDAEMKRILPFVKDPNARILAAGQLPPSHKTHDYMKAIAARLSADDANIVNAAFSHINQIHPTALQVWSRGNGTAYTKMLFNMADKCKPENETSLDRALRHKFKTSLKDVRQQRVEELHRGVRMGDLKKVKAELESGINVNASDKYGHTALAIAVEKNNVDIITFLLEKGADPESKLHHKRLVLRTKSDDVKALLIKHGAKPPRKKKVELQTAIMKGDTAKAKALIAAGADVNEQNQWGYTALSQAAYKNNIEIARLLIEKGADVNHADDRKETPLHSAAVSGGVEVATLLIAKGANMEAKDQSQETPLHIAARNMQLKYAALLLKKGANPNAKNYVKKSPMAVCEKNRSKKELIPKMKALLKKHGGK